MNPVEPESISNWWQNLKLKKQNFQFAKTKFISDKSEAKVKIVHLLNDKIEPVSQIPNFGLIVLNQTILNSHDKTSIAEQGFISSDFFKAKIIDVDSTTVKGVYFHLVKVISGIITISEDYELTLTTDEYFCQQLFDNKLAVKLFNLFLHHNFAISEDVIKKISVRIDDDIFTLKFNKKLNISKEMIFQTRDAINQCLENKRLNYQKYPFLKDELTKLEKERLTKLELIEVKNFTTQKNNFTVDFLVGKEKISDFFINSKKELFAGIKMINQKIKVISSDKISEFYPELIVDTYEKLEQLNHDYLKLKDDFTNFQNKNPELMKNFINDSIETQYSEKIGDYQFIHINFNNLLLDQDLLASKAAEKIQTADDQILFLSNNNLANSMVILKISQNLISEINITPLVNQFSNVSFKAINYNQEQDGVFIEADNYQVINDFIRNIINFFKISNNQTI
ncbi:hypothetical protein [Spiroplasma platyhelix]|uniref:Uncharacterized protein n=1 Tax=Spiroplasma platyhelix PALS-1 TaxID=1276218 RepID=A0A846U2H5_9MOLU|nr:hypothetical protein [Spiroplasma platyhelix]MBE4704347.1 hypothetical protein [Spiroplasma platyhelix PALS-1]NKE38719.1 hypothetical protein [Spiroplasma platyhelix PALS-1]UJB28929.1 hypothetical protein SPLAT_v1c01640 [Spiroplasma platyhelix PALS-1]